ncbi:terminase family protein [Vibrio parahaemolyticus]|nr:terminase family protein [Vibrio parahaemolyticus]
MFLKAGMYKQTDILKAFHKTIRPLSSDLPVYEYKKSKLTFPDTLREFEELYCHQIEPCFDHRDRTSLHYIGIDDTENRNKADVWFKKADVKSFYSQQHQQEFARCAADPIYFAEHYCFVEAPTASGLALARLFDYQKEIIWAAVNNKYTAANVSRQAGKTTSLAILIAWYLCFHFRFRVGVIAQDGSQASEIIRRIRVVLENLPDFLCPALVVDNTSKLVLENGSSVQGFASSKGIRGSSFGLTYIDEAAHVENFNDLIKSIMPIVARWKNNKIVMTSTPKGLNHWHEIFTKRPNYYLITAKWDQLGERMYDDSGRYDAGKSWKKNEIATNGKLYFDQEFEVKFLGSSKTLISTEFLKQTEASLIEHSTHLLSYGFAHVYKNPEKTHSYVLNADIGNGASLDYSAATVTDITTGEVVAIFYDNAIAPSHFAVVLEELGRFYHAWIVVEITNVRSSAAHVIKHLTAVEYPRMYSDERNRLGVETTVHSKKLGCSLLKTLVEDDGFKINSREILDELMRFCSNGKSYEGVDFNDDLTMCLVGLNLCLDSTMFLETVSESTYADWEEEDSFFYAAYTDGSVLRSTEDYDDIDTSHYGVLDTSTVRGSTTWHF